MPIRFRIVGSRLPGRGESNVHVGIQRGKEVVDLVPGDAESAVFEFEVAVRNGRFSGPYVHGQKGERFIYLSWGELDAKGDFAMFRRAKLQLDSLDAASLEGKTVTGQLGLTDSKGGPICASVRPPVITWTNAAEEAS